MTGWSRTDVRCIDPARRPATQSNPRAVLPHVLPGKVPGRIRGVRPPRVTESTLVDPPPPRNRPDRGYEGSRPGATHRTVDYLAMEARNSALGLEGERYVMAFERTRLVRAGKPNLAEKIEHTSIEEGDGAGFDVRSYESDGSDRFIEVKTTAYGIYTPLYLSRNELRVSQDKDERYHLYRPFQFRKSPRLFTVAGALDRTLRLEATAYVGRVG